MDTNMDMCNSVDHHKHQSKQQASIPNQNTMIENKHWDYQAQDMQTGGQQQFNNGGSQHMQNGVNSYQNNNNNNNSSALNSTVASSANNSDQVTKCTELPNMLKNLVYDLQESFHKLLLVIAQNQQCLAQQQAQNSGVSRKQCLDECVHSSNKKIKSFTKNFKEQLKSVKSLLEYLLIQNSLQEAQHIYAYHLCAMALRIDTLLTRDVEFIQATKLQMIPKMIVSEPMYKVFMEGYRTEKASMYIYLTKNQTQKSFPDILKSTLFKPRANQLVDQNDDKIQQKISFLLKIRIGEAINLGTKKLNIEINQIQYDNDSVTIKIDKLFQAIFKVNFNSQANQFEHENANLFLFDFLIEPLNDCLYNLQAEQAQAGRPLNLSKSDRLIKRDKDQEILKINTKMDQKQAEYIQKMQQDGDETMQGAQNDQPRMTSAFEYAIGRLVWRTSNMLIHKYYYDLQGHPSIKNLKQNNKKGLITFALILGQQKDQQVEVTVTNLMLDYRPNNNVQQLQTNSKSSSISEIFEIKLDQALPSCETGLFSNTTLLTLSSSTNFDIKWHINRIKHRFKLQYMQTIREALQDQIDLYYEDQVQIQTNNQTNYSSSSSSSISLTMFGESIKVHFQLLESATFTLQIAGSTHLSMEQTKVFNKMLEVLRPDDFDQVKLFLQILVPHCALQFIALAIQSKRAVFEVCQSIDKFVDLRRMIVLNYRVNKQNAYGQSQQAAQVAQARSIQQQQELYEKTRNYKTATELFLTAGMKALQQSFGFQTKDQLVLAQQHLYQGRMVIVSNHLPTIGDYQLYKSIDPNKKIQYLKIEVGIGLQGSNALRLGPTKPNVSKQQEQTSIAGLLQVKATWEQTELIKHTQKKIMEMNLASDCSFQDHGTISLEQLVKKLIVS